MVSDFSKKKRANRTAKLKQSKLDAKREQWLSQGKNKEIKVEINSGHQEFVHARDKGHDSLDNNLGLGQKGGDNNGTMHHQPDSDSESAAWNSPSSASSVFGSNESGTSYSSGSSSSGGSSSGGSGGCFSGNTTEEEDNDGCLDDWEAIADALAADEKGQNLCPDPYHQSEPVSHPDSSCGSEKSEVETSKSPECVKIPRTGSAWRAGDVSRPGSLPNLSKQHSFPMISNQHYGCGAGGWHSSMPVPSSCPICYEDLDVTDSFFFPCPCGFRLCLFCHKKILEGDSRCPGCRKPYETEVMEGETSFNGGNLTFHFSRSHSMITRP